MHDNTVGVGMFGLGARLRSLFGRVLEAESRIAIRGVFDPDPGSVTRARDAWKRDVRACRDEAELLSDPSVDWVAIGSWNRFHAAQAIAALQAGKHVFCEKPLATNLEDVLAVRDAVQASGKTFAFGLVLRYSPHYRRIRELLDEGCIGELISFEFNEAIGFDHGGYIFGNWRRHTANAGSHILEKCSHDLDLAHWMCGSLPLRVASFGGRRVFVPERRGLQGIVGTDEQGRSRYRRWTDPHGVDPFSGDTDLLDHQVAILEYANGVRATFHANAHASLPERRFYLLGTEGTLRAEAYDGTLEVRRLGLDTPVESLPSGVRGGHAGGDEVLAPHLVRMLLGEAPPLAGIDEAMRSAITAFAIDEAQTTGRVVDLRPTWDRAGLFIS